MAIWAWLGPLPVEAETVAPERAMTVPAVRDLGSGTGVQDGSSVPAPPVGRWHQAFADLEPMSVRQAVHRAAVSGRVEDIVAARAMLDRCSKLLQITPPAAPASIPPALIQRAQQASDQCEGWSVLSRQRFRLLDDGGDPAGAALAVAAMTDGLPTDALPALVDYLRAQRSPALVNAIFRRHHAALTESVGWRNGASVDQMLDDALLHHAVALAACEDQEDCQRRASERFDCPALGDCVDDLRDLVSRHVLVPSGQRAPWVQPVQIERIDEVMRVIEDQLRSLGRNPEALQQLRAELMGLCHSLDCLTQRWALAQARAACLAGQGALAACSTPDASRRP